MLTGSITSTRTDNAHVTITFRRKRLYLHLFRQEAKEVVFFSSEVSHFNFESIAFCFNGVELNAPTCDIFRHLTQFDSVNRWSSVEGFSNLVLPNSGQFTKNKEASNFSLSSVNLGRKPNHCYSTRNVSCRNDQSRRLVKQDRPIHRQIESDQWKDNACENGSSSVPLSIHRISILRFSHRNRNTTKCKDEVRHQR